MIFSLTFASFVVENTNKDIAGKNIPSSACPLCGVTVFNGQHFAFLREVMYDLHAALTEKGILDHIEVELSH